MPPSCTSASGMGKSSQSTGRQDISRAEYDCLHSCLSDFALVDMDSKARLLQSLSSYLSCVAGTMCASTEDLSLSAWVGTSRICIRNVEVIELHNLLIRELQNHTEFLVRPQSTSYIYSEAEENENDKILARNLHIEIVSETLRCCIRILPLVDCFDTSASLSGAALLDGLMQQLCSPTILYDVLSRWSDNSRCGEQQKTTWLAGQSSGVEREVLASTELFSVFSPRGDNVDVTDPNSQFERETQQRMDVFLAILEVYMDELLLCPDLGARFLEFRDEACLSFKQERLMSSFSRHAEASLEAAFVHALLSCLHKLPMHVTRFTGPSDESLVCNLSLPASVLLLERLAAENVPTMYMAHIAQLVARVLDSSTSRDIDQVAGLMGSVTREDISCWSGGVDWSYCLKRVSTKRDPVDSILKPKCLPSLTTIHFASSIFEQAMLLYRRFSTSSHLSNGGQSICQTEDNLFLRFCVSKYRPLLDIFCSHSEVAAGAYCARREGSPTQMLEPDEDMLQTGSTNSTASCSDIHLEVLKTFLCHDNQADEVGICQRTNDLYGVNEKVDSDGAASLVSAIMQLGISSLECITREIGILLQLSSDDLQFPGGQSSSTASFEDDVDRILSFVSLYLSSFLPIESEPYSEPKTDNHLVEDMDSPGQRSLISSVGKAILFFTNVFCGKVQNGVQEELLEDYFHLLESLIALLLVVHGSKSVRSSSEKKNPTHSQSSETPVDNSSIEKDHGDNSFISWLGEMVLLLQNMLEELSSQQRPLPEFFLDFVLEQISRGDGLSVVAMAFSGSFEQCRDGRDIHQSVMPNVGSFQSKGLVNQILQVALQKPNRPSSFSTLIGYLTNVLEDLLPITETLSLHEVSESLSCYEHIVSAFTLACQFAVSKQLMVIRNGHKCRSWLLSTMCKGLERLFTEGTAVIRWMSNWTSSKTIPASSPPSETITLRTTCSLETESRCDTSYSEDRQLRFCSSFLVQIDLLRRAVGAMHSATDWFLIPELEFSSLFMKSRTFLDAFSRLRMMVDKPVRQWRFHVFLQEQLSLHPFSDVEESQMMDKQHVNSPTDATDSVCDISSEDTPCNNIPGPEKCEYKGGSGQIQEENARRVFRGPSPLGRGSLNQKFASEHTAAGQMDNCAMNVDGELPGGGSSVGVELPAVKMSLTAKENDLQCRHTHLDVESEDREVGQGPSLTGLKDNHEMSAVPLVSKRITRSATMAMSQTSGGGADTPAAEVLADRAEPLELKKRLSCSSTTLAIVKRLTQMRQPLCKKAKRDTRGFTERYAQGLDLVALLSNDPEKICPKLEEERQTDGVAHQGAAVTAGVSNPFIQSLDEKDSYKENFSDLNDFIVCKKGRNYSKWLKKRLKVRRRLHTRNLFKRLQEKRDLLLLLDICE